MHWSFVNTSQPRGMSKTLTLCLQFPIVTTTLWAQLASKTMTVHLRSLLLYCTAMFVYVYQTPTFPLHFGDNVKVKTQHIYQAVDIPVMIRGWGEAVVTNDRRILNSPCADLESFARGSKLQRFFDGRIQIPLHKRAIIGLPVKRHLNGISLACRW